MESVTPLIDPFARPIRYLRVSVTDRCDFRCTYCMAEHMTFLPKADLLTLEELDRLCSTFVRLGTRRLRLSGGLAFTTYEISAADAAGPYVAAIPDDYAQKAALPHLSFTSTTEMLAE